MQIFHKSVSEQAVKLDQAKRSQIKMKNKRANTNENRLFN